MIPPVCFTCGKTIAHLWNIYVEKVNKLKKENDDEKDDDEKGDNNKSNTIEKKVLDEMKIKRYCCRRMILSNIDLSDKI